MRAKIITVALAATLTITSAHAQDKTPGYNHKIPEKIMTPDKVETRIGTLNFVDGVPTPETTKTVYDHLDFLRGVEVFLHFVPAASLEGMRLGAIESGATRCNQVLIADQLADSNLLFLTANTDTVYCLGFLDLEADGPTVVEIPPGCGPGTVDDAFFASSLIWARLAPIAAKAANTSSCPRTMKARSQRTKRTAANTSWRSPLPILTGFRCAASSWMASRTLLSRCSKKA